MTRIPIAGLAALALCACHPQFPGCRNDGDCTDAQNHGLRVHCIDGACQECKTDAECTIGSRCDNMRCVAGIASTAEPSAPVPAKSAAADNSARNFCNFPKIHFDYNSSALSPEALKQLQEVAACLSERPNLHLIIEGDCDDRGTEEYNLALGQRRASNVEKYLEGLGLRRLGTVSYGKDKPVCSENTEACYHQNRRAEFDVAKR